MFYDWRIMTSAGPPKPWDEFSGSDAPKLDFVFTVCDNAAKEVCPIWPGQPMTAHWGLPDPAKANGTEAERNLAFAEALRMLTNRIGIFVSLPLDKLDQAAASEAARRHRQSPDCAGNSLTNGPIQNVRFWHLADIGAHVEHVCF